MFGDISKTVVLDLGAENDLNYNENVNQKIEMLTLVKVRRNFLNITKYTIINKTLLNLLEEPDFNPDVTEEVLVVDFENQRDKGGRGSVEAGVDAPQMKVKLTASMDTVDGVSSFTLKKRTVDTHQLERMEDKKIKMKLVDMLKLKQKEKLTCVYQTVYNTTPVTFYVKARKSGLVSGMFNRIFHVSLESNKKEETSFTVPKDTTFAYGLIEINTQGGTLGIPPRLTKVTRHGKGWAGNISFDGDGDDSCKTLEELKEEISEKACLLKPLETLPQSSRRNLLKVLSELVRDRDALTLLEETLDKEMTECPQSQSVSSFMALLREASSKQRDAVHMLVTALDGLPDGAAALLTACSPETLRVLQQLVSCLMEDGQARLPESLPVSLQEEGEIRWLAEILCLTDQKLKELRDQWDGQELPREMLLELVCLVVQGLSLMQP
ncbi:Hypothetical predicted protein [Scomber scombrus]|uniref:Uncharacterized protein n=1 Tax=Scomber scombrus TaxID=13677 RepID=A0AAV1PW72_SCOSC|nr:uncharacterized protein LOC133995634 [Scomber scombrus]XP_062291095.1 uncharacterized protein LOC133995634 [Scomber scombrus]